MTNIDISVDAIREIADRYTSNEIEADTLIALRTALTEALAREAAAYEVAAKVAAEHQVYQADICANRIRALTPADAQAALQAMIDAAVKEARADDAELSANLAGCKIALKQAWTSNRERAARITALTNSLTELHEMVVGECPSLLNEDSGGNGELSCQINDLLTGGITIKTAVGKAADALLEHIVYYDLTERRGADIADAVIAELVEIAEAVTA